MLEDLLFDGNKLVSLLGIAGDGEASHRQFDTQSELDSGADDGVIAEDFLFAIWILGIPSYTDSGLCIGGQLWATKEEGVDLLCEVNLLDDARFDDEIEACALEPFLEAKDLIEGARVLGIGLLETQGEQFDLGPLDIFGEVRGWALEFDADLFSGDDFCGIIESVADSSVDVVYEPFELDRLTHLAEVGAAFVSGVCGEEGAIQGEDLIGDEAKELGDLHQDVEDLVVELFSQALLEIGEGGATRHIGVADAGVEPIMFAFFLIPDDFYKAFHVGEFFEVSKELQKKEAHRVIGKTNERVFMSDDGAHEGEVHQGADKAGQTSYDASVGVDFDMAALV